MLAPPNPASKRLAPGRLRAAATACEVLLIPGQTWPASLTPSEPSGWLRPPAKFSWYPASLAGVPDAFRGLGNLQRRVLELPSPRKPSAAYFGAFRGLGNVQRRVLMLSEPSETFSGAFWSFPRPRKRSAAGFDTFRGLGAAAAACEVCRVRAFEVFGRRP